jgi:hypothetical protein
MPPAFVDQLVGASWPEIGVILNKIVTERDGEWCGIPLPLPGMGLVLESKHPGATRLAELQRIMDDGNKPEPETPEQAAVAAERVEARKGWREINSWRGRTKTGVDATIVVLRHEDGRTDWGLRPLCISRNRMALSLFEALDAWNLDTECTAIDTLSTLLTERMYKAYILTGQFLETSKRSGLTYWFRRLAPTIVMTPHRDPDEMQILCTLCLHPVAYYATTRCGAMTPTDDVIAHLLLMRGDEHMFWKRANHHQAVAPESGL